MLKYRGRLLGASILLLWGLLLFELRPWPGPQAPAPTDASSAGRHVQARRRQRISPHASSLALQDDPQQRMRVQLGELIASVEVDKQRVCPDEDFKVSMRKLGSGEVSFSVDTQFGDEIVLRSKAPGLYTYDVVATNHADLRDYQRFELEVLPEDAPECRDRSSAVLAVRRSALQAAAALEVTSTRGLSGALSYRWDFGDGATQTTSLPRTYHSYEDRRQTRELSSYLITIVVEDEHGKRVSARGSVYFENLRFVARKYSGNRILAARYDRFPALEAGHYVAQASFTNSEELPVTLQHASVMLLSCTEGVEPVMRELPATQVIDTDRLSAGDTTTTTVRIPSAWLDDDRCVASIELSGDTEPPLVGVQMEDRRIPYQPVNTTVVLDVKPAPIAAAGAPDGRKGRPITDPERRAKLLKAIAILGTRRVTPLQLEELEATGRL